MPPTGGGGGGGGGLSSVTTDATLTGAGTVGSALKVAAPYNRTAPGALGGTTSNTAQFTNVAIGPSVPTLDGTAGDLTLTGSLVTGGHTSAGMTAGDAYVARNGANDGLLTLGGATSNALVGLYGQPAGLDVFYLGTVVFAVRNASIALRPLAFVNLPAAAASEGQLASVTDSTTATWGATITGSGTNHVLAYCDGTHWTVAGS